MPLCPLLVQGYMKNYSQAALWTAMLPKVKLKKKKYNFRNTLILTACRNTNCRSSQKYEDISHILHIPD